jgi:chitinase
VISVHDTENFLSFLKELRHSEKGSKLFLTAAASLSPWIDATGRPANMTEFSPLLDYIAIMNYDVWGSWSPTVGPNAPLNDTCALPANQMGSAVSAVRAWTGAGMPADQIVLAVGSYGHSFNVTNGNASTNGHSLTPYPKFGSVQPEGDVWDDQPGKDECGNPTGFGGIFNFWGMIMDGFLNTEGNPAHGIDYRYDSCSQTVSLVLFRYFFRFVPRGADLDVLCP